MEQNATYVHGSNELIDHANAAAELSEALKDQRALSKVIAITPPEDRRLLINEVMEASTRVSEARAAEYTARQVYVNPFQVVKSV